MRSDSTLLRTLASWLPLVLLGTLLAACQPIQPESTGAASTVPSTPVIPPEGQVVSMWVGPQRQSCTGVAPMMCLQVKWSEEGAWENFYSGIDGFIHVPGYQYELRVRQQRIDPAPADGSSIAWTLEEVVSRTPDFAGDPLSLVGTSWQLVAFGEHEIVDFDPSAVQVTALFGEDGSLSGNAGCNRFMSTYAVAEDVLTVQPLATTRKLCGDAEMAVETAFLNALPGAHRFLVNGDKLEVIYAAGELIFQGSVAE